MRPRDPRSRLVQSVCLSIAALVMLALVPATAGATTPAPGAVRQNAGFKTNDFGPSDDGSLGPVGIGFPNPIDFFGTSYSQLHVNNNGNVTFGQSLSDFTPFPLSSNQAVIIAPFFADVDTRASSSTVTYGTDTVDGHPAFGVDWINVNCYYAFSHSHHNSFQLVLVDRSDIAPGDFDIELNYDQISWEAGTASGGNGNCLGGSAARAGYSNGSDNSFELAGSGENNCFLDSNVDGTSCSGVPGLIYRSLGSDQLGRYVIPVRSGTPIPTSALEVSKTADSATSAPGDADGYTITVDNPNDASVALDSISDTLPEGFAYTSGSTSGVTELDPSVDGQTLTWDMTGVTVPGSGSISISFGVTVSDAPGVYYNDATAAAGDLDVIGATHAAPVTILGCNDPTRTGDGKANTLVGTSGDDQIVGGGGRDRIDGQSGDDQLCGGARSDYLYGRDGADYLQGDGGNDRLYGGSGDDVMTGGAGQDTFIAGAGTDTINAEDGTVDCIIATVGVDTINADPDDLINPADGCDPGF